MINNNLLSLFELQACNLEIGFFSKSFLSLYSCSFFVIPFFEGFFFFLDVFFFFFFFLFASFLRNIYFHNYLSLILFFDLALFKNYYLFVLNSNNILLFFGKNLL
jgi:hypothetical protein